MPAATDLIIGLDIGGTKVAGALVKQTGELLHRRFASTLTSGLSDPALAVSTELVEGLLAQAHSDGLVVAGIGIGLPEYVRPDGFVSSRLVLGWDSQPSEVFGKFAPTTVDSDVRCGARAEACFGSARNVSSALYVTVGTGLSSTLIIGGHIFGGARGEAIAFGELPVAREIAPETELTLEEFASGRGIANRYAIASGTAIAEALEVVQAELVDPRAGHVIASAARALGRALAWAVGVLDPELIVLGGGLGTSDGFWRRELNDEYRLAVSVRPDAPPLMAAAFGADAGIVGAALAHRDALDADATVG